MLLGRCWSPTRRGQLTGGRSCWPPPPPHPGSRPSSSPATSPHLTTNRSSLTAVLWIRITLMRIRIRLPDADPDSDFFIWCGSGSDFSPWSGSGSKSFEKGLRFRLIFHTFWLTSANWCGFGSGFFFWCGSFRIRAFNIVTKSVTSLQHADDFFCSILLILSHCLAKSSNSVFLFAGISINFPQILCQNFS